MKRSNSGVKPSVEVKKPDTPEPVEVEELIDQQEDEKQNPQPEASPTTAPKPEVKTVLEDLQLKKALELLSDKAQAVKNGSGE
ncbi:PDZ domain-containing protein [Biomphalaria pfeifferi]|uniref:PDZ domain-containing protein n=1 Tax=Biomphalaria pfeifferi TaxID=112525 RepID=A0AAD8ANB2_BIOPF|nr:PDZ domain-containing protein [Biomphalaria pfeifferi]